MTSLPSALWADLIGLPFRRGGRGPDSFDCYGLLLEIYRRRGVDLKPLEAPVTNAGCHAAYEHLLPLWSPCQPRAGACLLFRDEGLPIHVGVAIDEDLFIHAAQRIGQVGLDYLSRPWGRLLISAYEPAHAV